MSNWTGIRNWNRAEMFIIGGNQPQAEFTPLAMQRCEAWKKQKNSLATKPNRRPASKEQKASWRSRKT